MNSGRFMTVSERLERQGQDRARREMDLGVSGWATWAVQESSSVMRRWRLHRGGALYGGYRRRNGMKEEHCMEGGQRVRYIMEGRSRKDEFTLIALSCRK